MKAWQIGALVVFAPTLLLGINLLNKPAALVNKATDTTKMLANYEWFHEAANAYNARVAQIRSHKALIAGETDRSEVSRLNIELAAMKQSCRDLSARYEAKSGQVHVGYLKGSSLPESLDPKACE